MPAEIIILKLSIVLIVGFVGSLIAKKIKLPNISGYLLFGLFLGPSLGLIFSGYQGFISTDENQMLSFISEISLGFIAISVGSEFTLRTIKKMGKIVANLALWEVIGSVVLVFIVMLFIPKPTSVVASYDIFSKDNVAFSLILAAISASTATAAILMIIRQYKSYGPVTKALLSVTALDDILGIVAFGFLMSLAKILLSNSAPQSIVLLIAKPFIEVFGSLLIGLVLGYVLSKLVNYFNRYRDEIQLLVLLTVFFTIGINYYLNELLSTYQIAFSHLLSNIMIGAVIANMAHKPDKAYNSINDLSTPFYVLFFTLAGASLDLSILKSEILIVLLAAVYIVTRAIGKLVGIYIGATISKAPKTVKKYLGFALFPQSGISIGLLVIVSAQAESLYPVVSTVILLSILVYETIGPLFAKYAITKAGEIDGLGDVDDVS